MCSTVKEKKPIFGSAVRALTTGMVIAIALAACSSAVQDSADPLATNTQPLLLNPSPSTTSSQPETTSPLPSVSSSAAAILPDNAMRDNQEEIALTKVSATYSFDGSYSITSGQPWGGVTSNNNGGNINLDVQAGRHNSSGPASWFKARTSNMICDWQCKKGESPNELNFAFTGTITIDGNGYPIVIGQGHSTIYNNWWFGGPGWTSASSNIAPNGGIVTPDGKFVITSPMQDGGVYLQPN